MSFKRKLRALGHPNPDKVDAQKENQFRDLVIWLEDQKIRHYTIDDRRALRDTNSPDWKVTFDKYLTDLVCPILSGSQLEVLDWLLGVAVRYEYGESPEKYNSAASGNISSSVMEQPRVVSSNPLDSLDLSSKEFRAGVEGLADRLGIMRHPDHLVTLVAVCRYVSTRLTASALADPGSVIPRGEPVQLKDAQLGFDTGDEDVNEAAKILRLLHIKDLRSLQTGINECIVAIQSLTANPKTDTRLGKVGR